MLDVLLVAMVHHGSPLYSRFDRHLRPLRGLAGEVQALVLRCLIHYNGIFPCFFGGFSSRLFCSISSAEISRGRVSRGSITSST